MIERPRSALPSLEEASVRAGGGEDATGVESDDRERESELPGSSAFAAEDFLYHLYRGSELLQDNRVGEAKEELERALAFQPEDVEGQGLLGAVYFRLGLYPRAISIFEEIVRVRPDAETPRLNLGLCFLKTGQLLRARDALEQLLERNGDHKRAWGYLGLVHQRLGDFDKAAYAFERAGQAHLARRMHQETSELEEPPAPAELQAVREVAAEAVHEIDTQAEAFSRAEPEALEPALRSRWRALELGGEHLPPPSRPLRPRPSRPPSGDVRSPLDHEPPSTAAFASPRRLAEKLLLARPKDGRVERRSDAVALLELQGGFAVRLEHVRALLPESGSFSTQPIHRRARGRDLDEPLGGMRSPMLVLEGRGALALSAEPGLLVTELERELFYVREERVIGFDVSLRHESGRLGVGAMEHVPMLQLSGEGLVALRSTALLFAVEATPERPALLRGASVVGWIGRLLPQPVATQDAPMATSGLVRMNGEGVVFLDPV
ncbi:MAG: tetratricopeptide repeat protein [Polyangiaceae bacterium]